MNEGKQSVELVAIRRASRKQLRQGLGDQLEVIESLLEMVGALLKNRQYQRAEELVALVKALDSNYSLLDEAALTIEKELES